MFWKLLIRGAGAEDLLVSKSKSLIYTILLKIT